MPIEFSCNQCGKQLRTPDETAGRNAKCPQCGAIMQIPHSATLAPQGSAGASPFGPQAAPQSPPGGDFNFNPYSSPRTAAGYSAPYSPQATAPLASLGARLGGSLLDGLISFVGALPGFIFFIINVANHQGGPPPPGREAELLVSMAGPMALMYGGALVVGIVNWVLIAQSGQSLGKRIVGTRIVRLDGSLPGFGYGVALRSWVPFIIGMIPWIGGLFGLVNILFIFGQERRCIHDHIAGTRVIVA